MSTSNPEQGTHRAKNRISERRSIASPCHDNQQCSSSCNDKGCPDKAKELADDGLNIPAATKVSDVNSVCCKTKCDSMVVGSDIDGGCELEGASHPSSVDLTSDECGISCCQGQDGPRCDEECIEAYAKYDCLSSTETDACHGSSDHSPCNSHWQAAFERYGAMVKKAQCLCRNALNNSLVRCCEKKAGYRAGSRPGSSTKATYAKACDAPKSSLETTIHPRTCKPGNNCSEKPHDVIVDSCSPGIICSVGCAPGGCCKSSGSPAGKHDTCIKVRAVDSYPKACAMEKASPVAGLAQPNICITKWCCSGEGNGCNDTRMNSNTPSEALVDTTTCASEKASQPKDLCSSDENVDVEVSSAREHILLRVRGMTCTGCESKLVRILHVLPGVSNIRVVFVSGRADFDLDPSVISVTDAISRAQAASGFEISRIRSEYQTIDVLMNKDVTQDLTNKPPLGVTDIEILDKSTARFTYDPAAIGARDLMRFLGPRASGLPAPNGHGALQEEKKHLRDLLAKTLLATCFTIPVVVLAWADSPIKETTQSITSLILATFVQGLAVTEFYYKAINSLVHSHTVELDMLIVISITAAYIYSIVAFIFLMIGRPLEIREFFETSTLLITLVLLGRLIAAYARARAVEAVSLRSLQVAFAILTKPDGTEEEIDARLLEFRDQFLVKPHSRIPTDGIIIEGNSEIDESMLTGEDLPVAKSSGDNVIAGTMNGNGTLKAQLTHLPGKNTVSEIALLVDEAQNTKPRVQELADQVAGYFIPVILTMAIVAFSVWLAVLVHVRNQSGGSAVVGAVSYAIAILAMSCPCGLGLAVPMVLVVAGGVAARAGVIIKSATATERAWKLTDVVFDKTGTLTTGELTVVAEKILATDWRRVVSITYALVQENKHPVSASTAQYLGTNTPSQLAIRDVEVIPGAGIQATFDGRQIRAGNPQWLRVENAPDVRQLLATGSTTLCVTEDSNLLAVFGLKSTLRAETEAVVAELRRRKLTLHLVSGDTEQAVQTAAQAVGISLCNVRSCQSPVDKQEYVRSLMEQGRRVAFCGDGINDAVAIAQADIGVQMGTTSDVVGGTADVSMLGSLTGIVYLLDVSRAAYRRIVFNFVWSAVYNVFAILLAGGAFVKVRIAPAYAGLGEIVSVLPVIVAALTMFHMRYTAQ